MKISYRKSLKLVALLISSLLIATVSATAYVTLQWTTTATVVANPKLCFVSWADGTTKANNFTYSVNIFPNVVTIDPNITYGVWDWDTVSHNTYVRWTSCSNTGNIASLNVTVYNGTSTLYTQLWTSIPTFPTAFIQFSPSPANGTKYTIWIEINATTAATGSSTFAFDMKVENP
jgi:hypothetical protein